MQSTQVTERSGSGHSTTAPAKQLTRGSPEWWQMLYGYYAQGRIYSPSVAVAALLELEGTNAEFLAIWRSELEHQERASLGSFVAALAADTRLITKVLADYSEDTVDLLFVVEGDLYEGETEALSLMRRIRRNFPSREFDLMVLPASAFSRDFKWGSNGEVVFER